MRHETETFTPLLLKEEDAPELAALEAACFTLPWSEAQYRQILARREAEDHPDESAALPPPLSAARLPVFGLRAANGELAAYVSLGVYQTIREMEIYNIAVRASFRRRGLGKGLLGHVLELARRQGVSRALLEVRPSNAAALALYASMGFALCGSRKGYYPDSGEDAFVLACDLYLAEITRRNSQDESIDGRQLENV